MAVLTNEQRAEEWATFMSDLSGAEESTGTLGKDDIRAVIDALDAFMEAHASDVNAAIPQPARGIMTAAQKARALTRVVYRRYIEGA